MHIAIAQILCRNSDRTGNLRRIENAIKAAKKQDADLVVFPESVILGWLNPDAHHRASPIPGPDSDLLCQLAKKYRLHLCIGLDEKEGDWLFGSVILVDDQGNLLLKHRKTNVLPELMTPPYTAGKGVTTVQTKFGKTGLLICADSFRDDILLEMQQQKPDLLLIPYGWAAPENNWPAHGKALHKVVQNAAQVVGCPVIGSDLVGRIAHGPWKGQIYGGQSVACQADGKIIAIAKDRAPDTVVFEVEMGGKSLVV